MASFLDLPGELRNQIYEHALIMKSPIEFGRMSLSPWARDNHQILTIRGGLAMLATCRQIRSEALAYFYSKNEFIIRLRDYGNQFLENLTNDATSKLENVRLRWPLGLLLHHSYPETSALGAIIVVDEISKIGQAYGRKGLKIEAVWSKWYSVEWARLCDMRQFCWKVEDNGSWWVNMGTGSSEDHASSGRVHLEE
ncbi:hypothetical protein HII31_05392 [Pseudocercospora fuligena]|uniref:DUF7730 domain-containing protein n=1 Tax=Pseudocercospora fuligena TaxID=685502 RepID=A0A8H6RM03_9PEZI|nr:hypothetical protein HII31_05392 [Pseudocercospora fuligena]